MTRAALAFLLALLASCSGAVEAPSELATPSEPLVWPPPPEQPRIKFLYAFREPKDLGFRVSLFGRLWDLIAGEETREMIRPYALAVDQNSVAVADPGARVVHLYDMRAQEYARIEKAGGDVLVSPVGVALGPERIYVADSALGKVFAFGPEGALAFTIEGLRRPTGLAYDAGANRLYVADTLAHRIVVFDDGGEKLFSFGRRGTGRKEFNYPTHISVSADRLYVNDTMNFRLQVFDLDGAFRASFGTHGDGSGDLAQPKGVAVDAEGDVYLVDALFNRVQIFDSNGRFLLAFGAEGTNVGSFWLPSGMFIARDRIYVADSYNRRVQVFQFLGGGQSPPS
ncbi:MAG: 6-bladed beta-propeller [Kiloniellaceae bacterium]